MWVLGLLGGICSGKTFVAKEFARYGATVFEADRCVHQLLEIDDVCRRIAEHFGPRVLGPDARINRGHLANLVFGSDPDSTRNRKWLEDLLHPEVHTRLQQAMAKSRQSGCILFVIDAPLLLEANWSTLCHRLVYIDAPEELRYARATERGFDPAELTRRETAQASLNLKKIRADYVIDNGLDRQQTQVQVARIVKQLSRNGGG